MISGFLTSKRIAIQDRQCPWKYAPPSPKNIFPQGKFNKKSPKELRKKTRQSNTTKASEVTQAITVRKKDVDKDIPKDKPFKPSITLNECVTPVDANIENKIANGDNKKSWSTNRNTFGNKNQKVSQNIKKKVGTKNDQQIEKIGTHQKFGQQNITYSWKYFWSSDIRKQIL